MRVRRQLGGAQEERGGAGVVAEGRGLVRRLVQREGGGGARPRGGAGDVVPALDRAFARLRESRVHVPALVRQEPLVRRGREQGVGERDARPVQLDDPCASGGAQPLLRDAGAQEELDGRVEGGCGGSDGGSGGRIERLDAVCERAREGGRRRHRLARGRGGSRQLEREHRAAARRAREGLEVRPGESRAERGCEDGTELGRRERADLDPIDGRVPLAQIERRRGGRAALGSRCDEDADRRGRDAAEGEGEHRGRRPVEPLDVVDRDQQPAVASAAAQELEDASRERVPVDRPGGGRAGERALDRNALRRRKQPELLVRRRLEQVRQSRVRELHLALGRSGREHPQAAVTRDPNALLPDRRLAEPALAVEHERRGSFSTVGQERLDRAQLLLPPDDLGVRRLHG